MTRSIASLGGVRLCGALVAAMVCLVMSGARLRAADLVLASVHTTIVVRLVDNVGLAQRDVREASRVAAEILRAGGVDVHWVQCHSSAKGAAEAPCHQPLQANESVLRLIPSADPMTAQPASLGFTLLDQRGRRAVLSTVFIDRVRIVAERAQVDPSQLAGRAMAHELGHLLLGTAGHGTDGLMRAFWPDEMLRSRAVRDWRLQPSEMDAIRRGQAAGPELDAVGGS